jgi:pectinesterase
MRAAAQALAVPALWAGLAACAGRPQIEGMTHEVSGSATRPQLTARQAAAFTRQRVLAAAGQAGALVEDGWDPLTDTVITGSATPALHYRVDPRAADGRTVFASVQAAVNRAHGDAAAGRIAAERLYIGIAPGDYHELVYLPAGKVPITLWGLGADAGQVRIHHAIDAAMPAADYIAQQAPVFEASGMHADIAALLRGCARQATIGTGCAAVLWTRRDGLQLRRLTVENSYDQSRGGAPRQATGQHQAVALKSEGADRLHLEQVQLLGHQDTLYLAASAPDRTVRSFIHRSLVAGDVDFIFGPTTAYFLSSEIRFVGGLRNAVSGYVAAPSTHLRMPYGLVFEDCDFTAAGGGQLAGQGGVFLARQWFSGARCSPYGTAARDCAITGKDSVNAEGSISLQTLESVGKMVVLRSRLGAHLRTDAPWSPWQADRSARNHRPAQYDSDDFWLNLQAAGRDPAALGYLRPSPPEPYLAEFRNSAPVGPTAALR